jgi:hypothetical protein
VQRPIGERKFDVLGSRRVLKNRTRMEFLMSKKQTTLD